MITAQPFDSFALAYDEWFDNHPGEYAQELSAVRALLPKGGQGLEIGAGTGRFSQPLGISLAVEPAGAMRNLAFGRGVNIVAGTAEALPVADGKYDFALLVTVVCFLDDPAVAFREVYRVLKDEGCIIVGLIDKNSRLGRIYAEKKSESTFYKDALFRSVEEIQQDLERVWFSGIECVQAILPGDCDGAYTQEVKPGYGEGSFVVMRAQKGGGA